MVRARSILGGNIVSVDVDLSEVAELATELGEAGAKATGASSADMTKIAAQLRDDASAAVAVLTGATKGSIRVQDGDGYRIVKADDEAAFPLEFGTSDTAPQPFMWPQAPAAAERLQKAMEGIDPFA